MDRMRIAEDNPTKLVLEKSLAVWDLWRGWGNSLIKSLLFLAGSSIFLFLEQHWLTWVIFAISFIAVVFFLLVMLASQRKITVTIDLHSQIATRVEKLFYGKVTKNELALDQISRILIHSQEAQHAPRITIWLDAKNYPPLEIVNNYDLKSLVGGSYMDTPSEDISEINSLDILGIKIGELLGKPVVNKMTDYQGNIISEKTKSSW